MVKNTRWTLKTTYTPKKMSDGSWLFWGEYWERWLDGNRQRKRSG